MFEMIRDLFLNPEKFFRENIQKPPSLKEPTLIVLAAAVFAGVYAAMTSDITARIFTGPAAQVGGIVGIFGGVAGFIAQILMWLVVTVVFYLVSMAFSGKGTFKKTLEVTGFGMLPLVIANAINVALAAYYLPLVKVTPVTSMDPSVLTAAISRLMQDPSMQALSLSATVTTVVFFIWCTSIWIFGIRHARGLTMKHAAICVVVPVAIYLAAMVVSSILGQKVI